MGNDINEQITKRGHGHEQTQEECSPALVIKMLMEQQRDQFFTY